MEKIENKCETHEQMLERIISLHFGEKPKKIERMTMGICNEVYNIVLKEREIIARLSEEDDYFLKGSSKHIPMFKKLGIMVPDILFEDYSKKDIPYSFQFLSKLPGRDLGYVIEELSDDELQGIAEEVSNIINKSGLIPAREGKFGVVCGEYADLSESWAQRMRMWIQETIERGSQTGVINEKWRTILKELFEKYQGYFNQIHPITYLSDICSKNIMVDVGRFSGVVDLDGLTQGDPIEAIGRIKASWPGTHYGEFYANTIMNEQGLNDEQRKMVSVYAVLNRIAWACENGIQFNQNTTAIVDQERLQKDKEAIDILLKELEN